jgi:hypothetical protein
MFIPFGLLALALIGYGVYWTQIRNEILDGVEKWAERARADGYIVSLPNPSISGFPYRFELSIDAPAIAAPKHPNTWSWGGERIRANVLPYRLNHVIVRFEGAQNLTYTDPKLRFVTSPIDGEIKINAANARASVILRNREPDQISLDIQKLTAQHRMPGATNFENFTAERIQIHSRVASSLSSDAALTPSQGITGASDRDFLLKAEGMVLPDDPADILGPAIELVEAEGQIRGVPNQFAGDISPDQLLKDWRSLNGSLDLATFVVQWGDLDLFAEGEFRLDQQYRPEGAFTMMVGGYNGVVDGLAKTGRIDKSVASITKSILGLLSATGRDPDGRIRVPIRMEQGGFYLGPARLGNLKPVTTD